MKHQSTVVLGAQWGDEGKGKIVDRLSETADWVVRFQGGNNAGHSLWVNGQKTVLHLVPSGILHPHTLCMIGEGVVLDPNVFQAELVKLMAAKVFSDPKKRFRVSERTHLILPFHRWLDQHREAAKKGTKALIGTTGRGIGPCYETKVARVGIRAIDLFKGESHLKNKVDTLFAEYRSFSIPDEVERETFATLLEARKNLDEMVCDFTELFAQGMKDGKKILFEGAQGVMLDVAHGTYPYVTSSNTVSPYAAIGVGYPRATRSAHTVGIAKAYLTRVGSGPMVTEMLGHHVEGELEVAEEIRKIGQEFGATTGRPRRIGWQDLFALRYAVRVAGIDALALMKSDILSGRKSFKVCVGYQLDGKSLQSFPADADDLLRVVPEYQEVLGWEKADPSDPHFKAYLDVIENFVGVPIEYVGYGPERDQLWVRA